MNMEQSLKLLSDLTAQKCCMEFIIQLIVSLYKQIWEYIINKDSQYDNKVFCNLCTLYDMFEKIIEALVYNEID